MCGIFGYVGKKNGVTLAFEGLKRMEYRGYDSAGICCILDKHLVCKKATGKLDKLLVTMDDSLSSSCIIAHTRWATHGKVSESNAHPILDNSGSVAVVHNGVVDNYLSLKGELEKQKIIFHSETDTEVIANLIAMFYKGDLLKAVQELAMLVQGAWSIVVIHKDHPEEIVVARHASPLVLGIGDGESFVASDPNALLPFTQDVLYLEDNDVARITPQSIEIFDGKNAPTSRIKERLQNNEKSASKGSFEHFTLKEIFEQPTTVLNAMEGRFSSDSGNVTFEELSLSLNELLGIKRILIIACGTSYYAGMIAAYMLEEIARIPTTVEISSEYRYRNPIVEKGTLVLAISQSGETADTIAAVREVKTKGAHIIALCNVYNSTLAREAHSTLFLKAGPEIGVCSTKAFTSQLTVLMLFTLMMARLHHADAHRGKELLQALQDLPSKIEAVLHQTELIQTIAEKYHTFHDCYFIGRRYMFPTALEGALKLKELAYINACGYAAGEMKHGPIALLSTSCPTIALCTDSATRDKLLGNVMEAKARHSPVIAVVFEGEKEISSIADACITIPKVIDELSPIVTVVACQLYSYFCAKKRGADIDQPKNLAKSVTVE